jgi:hypothetical protein
MKIKLHRLYTTKKKKRYCTYQNTIPKKIMEQCNWENVKELNISIGFQSNGKPFLMLNELPKK